MSAKGRVKWTDRQLPSMLEQMPVRPFDERSEPEKPTVFRVSAHDLQKSWYNKSIFRAISGRMAIHTMCGLCTWYNKSIFRAISGRMAIHTMCGLCTWYNER